MIPTLGITRGPFKNLFEANQPLNDSDIDKLMDHFEVKDLTLRHSLRFDFHISFDWPWLGLFPSPFRDVGFHFDHSNHSQWSLHAHSRIVVRPLTCASDFTCTRLSSN